MVWSVSCFRGMKSKTMYVYAIERQFEIHIFSIKHMQRLVIITSYIWICICMFHIPNSFNYLWLLGLCHRWGSQLFAKYWPPLVRRCCYAIQCITLLLPTRVLYILCKHQAQTARRVLVKFMRIPPHHLVLI